VDGTVINILSEVGEVVLPGMPMVTLADLDQLQVETTNLSELDVGRVKPGQSVTIYIEALQDKQVEGNVQQIAQRGSLLGGDVVFAVGINLNETPPGLRPGMSVDVIIHTE
jgi:multidrug resistance efflux pump